MKWKNINQLKTKNLLEKSHFSSFNAKIIIVFFYDALIDMELIRIIDENICWYDHEMT